MIWNSMWYAGDRFLKFQTALDLLVIGSRDSRQHMTCFLLSVFCRAFFCATWTCWHDLKYISTAYCASRSRSKVHDISRCLTLCVFAHTILVKKEGNYGVWYWGWSAKPINCLVAFWHRKKSSCQSKSQPPSAASLCTARFVPCCLNCLHCDLPSPGSMDQTKSYSSRKEDSTQESWQQTRPLEQNVISVDVLSSMVVDSILAVGWGWCWKMSQISQCEAELEFEKKNLLNSIMLVLSATLGTSKAKHSHLESMHKTHPFFAQQTIITGLFTKFNYPQWDCMTDHILISSHWYREETPASACLYCLRTLNNVAGSMQLIHTLMFQSEWCLTQPQFFFGLVLRRKSLLDLLAL